MVWFGGPLLAMRRLIKARRRIGGQGMSTYGDRRRVVPAGGLPASPSPGGGGTHRSI